MERIEPVRRPAAPVRRRPKLTPVSVCQAIHDAPYGLARLVRRGVGAVGYWLAWTWDAVVTDQKQMYHDFLRSRFITRWRAFFRSPTLTGFAAALRSNWLVRLTAMAALTAAIFVGVSLDPSVPTLDAICILVDSSGPHVVSQDTEELDTGYLSLRRSLGGSHDMQYLLPAGQSINVTHNGQTITAVSQAERLPAFLDRCGIQLGSDEMVELNLTGDELSIRISGTLTYQHFVTVETDYEIKRTPDPLMDQGTEEIIRKHSQHEYYVYMLGFAPGHPYMARFDEPFGFKRRESPRVKIPARSIVVQQNLSDFIPFEQPCGWNIIGSTPLDICNFDNEDPFLVHAGDWVKHVPVTKSEYDKIRRDVEKGTYKVKTYTPEGNA